MLIPPYREYNVHQYRNTISFDRYFFYGGNY